MKDDAMKHGAFGWTELMTTDVEAAKTFYTGLFGWETEKAPMDGVEYTIIKVKGNPVGGMMVTPPENSDVPPNWGTYVTVDDVDGVAARVETLGGRILRAPEDIPQVGRFCVIQDPQGAVICAIQYVAP